MLRLPSTRSNSANSPGSCFKLLILDESSNLLVFTLSVFLLVFPIVAPNTVGSSDDPPKPVPPNTGFWHLNET